MTPPAPGITERLANMSIPTVLIVIAVLLAIRFLLGRNSNKTVKSVAETAESLAVALALVFLIIRPFLIQAFYIPSASMHPTLLESDRLMVNKLIYRFREPSHGDIVVFKAPPEADPAGQERDFIKRVIAVPGDVVRITPGYVVVGNFEYNHADLRRALAGYARRGADGAVKLMNDNVLVDGQLVSKSEVATALSGNAADKVKIVPGKVYVNGDVKNERYTAEDPDLPYPLPQTNPEWIITKDGVQFVKIPKGRLLVCGDNRNDSNDSRFWGLLDRKRVLGKAMFIFWPPNRIRWIQ